MAFRCVTLQLVYETHSLTTDNEVGVATGWLPGQLSERGQLLAAELGARRREDGIAAVYVSDLRRALQTTEIAFAGTSLQVVPDPRLRECNYGELNGMPTHRLEDERVRHVDEAWPGGESYRQVVARTAELLGELLAT
jgi:alpha-ribazole phosphatase/probable phosphoglycerate mutase